MAGQVQKDFEGLATKYAWDKSVVTWMLAKEGLAAKSVDDFEYAVAQESVVRLSSESVGGLQL